jgi:DNA polymerase III delta prime subunit
MAKSAESHWENRVRQARRKLVDEGAIDNSERGSWQLSERSDRRAWIEKCFVKGRPDRETGDHALGRALWSPTRSRDGHDSYRNMRRVQPGDVVLHLVDAKEIVGISTISQRARTDFVGLPGTEWADRSCYRVSLENFRKLSSPIDRSEFFDAPEYRQKLDEMLKNHDGLFYSRNMELNQGAYLTEAPQPLLEVFNQIHLTKTGEPLPIDSSGKSAGIDQTRLAAAVELFRWINGESGFASNRYKDEERNYKVAFSQAWRELATQARFEGILTGDPGAEIFASELGALLTDQKRSNLLPWRYADALKGPWEKQDAEILLSATHKLLFDSDRAAPAIDEFNTAMTPIFAKKLNTTAIKPASHCIPSLMLWLSEPHRQFYVRPELYNRAVSVLFGNLPEGQGNIMNTLYYQNAMQFARDLSYSLNVLRLTPEDMIDVQGFLWVVFSHNKIWFGEKSYEGTKDMLPEFRRRGVYAVGLARRQEIASLLQGSSSLGKSERDARRAQLEGTLETPAEKNALISFFDLAGAAGSLLLAKSLFDDPGAKQSLMRISGLAVTGSTYSFDENMGHELSVDWRAEPDHTVALTGPTFQKLLGTLASLPLADTLDVLGTKFTGATKAEELIEEPQGDPEEPALLLEDPPIQPKYTLDDFEKQTKIAVSRIEQWIKRLQRKQQIIIQGPPGTGKTFIAERLARLLVSQTHGFWEVVQFHPSYAYEDFMQGIRPNVTGGGLRYDIEAGRFLKFCKRARDKSLLDPCVLIVDEINRANLSRVFGELMYLLEYRTKEIPLSLDGKLFRIPENVFLIGTMNTADRSIALVDHALRRRFSFIRLDPDYAALAGHLISHGLPADSLVAALKTVNSVIDDSNYCVGTSFFLTNVGSLRSNLEEIWRSEIEPYLEEYFYGHEEKLHALRWDNLIKGQLADWS